MNASLVLTIIGGDRPGLVESVAAAIADHGGNWLESRMARLAGRFAGILHVELPADRVDTLKAALVKLEAKGLTIVVQPSDLGSAGGPGATTAATATGRAVELELVGLDRAGIVRDISAALAQRGVNVEELETETTPAPMSGEMLFKAHARLHIPPAADLDELRAALERLAHDLMVEVTLQAPAEMGKAD